jgi:hypothetical protein
MSVHLRWVTLGKRKPKKLFPTLLPFDHMYS